MNPPHQPRFSRRRTPASLPRRFFRPILLALSLLALVGCYAPFHRIRDLGPEFHPIGDWHVRAWLASVPYSENAYVEVRAWYGGADKTRIPLQDELLVVDRFEVEYAAENVVQGASTARCRFEAEYEQPGVAAHDVDFFPARDGRLLAAAYHRPLEGQDDLPGPPAKDAYLTRAPLSSCPPVATFLQDVDMAWQAYWVRDLDPDTLRVEPWSMPAPSSFGAIWESGEIREPGKNGAIRISFRVRIYDLPSCGTLHEEEFVAQKERRTEWDWYMGN